MGDDASAGEEGWNVEITTHLREVWRKREREVP
jgi:hypothetical protein